MLIALDGLRVDPRWAKSGFRTLLVMHRQTVETTSQLQSTETSYYVSNLPVSPDQPAVQADLFNAVREHWVWKPTITSAMSPSAKMT